MACVALAEEGEEYCKGIQGNNDHVIEFGQTPMRHHTKEARKPENARAPRKSLAPCRHRERLAQRQFPSVLFRGRGEEITSQKYGKRMKNYPKKHIQNRSRKRSEQPEIHKGIPWFLT